MQHETRPLYPFDLHKKLQSVCVELMCMYMHVQTTLITAPFISIYQKAQHLQEEHCFDIYRNNMCTQTHVHRKNTSLWLKTLLKGHAGSVCFLLNVSVRCNLPRLTFTQRLVNYGRPIKEDCGRWSFKHKETRLKMTYFMPDSISYIIYATLSSVYISLFWCVH